MLSMSCNVWVRPGITVVTLQDYIHRTTKLGVNKHMSSRWGDMQHQMCIFA